MSHDQTDRFPVNQLTQRYDLARSAVYTRLDALGIKPEKVGNRAYLSPQQLDLLDELHDFIQEGGQTAAFLEKKGLAMTAQTASEIPEIPLMQQAEIAQLAIAISTVLAKELKLSAQTNPLAHFQALEQAVHGGWLLSTSEIISLLNMPLSSISEDQASFSEAGFVFTQSGHRATGEIAWKVSKPQ